MNGERNGDGRRRYQDLGTSVFYPTAYCGLARRTLRCLPVLSKRFENTKRIQQRRSDQAFLLVCEGRCSNQKFITGFKARSVVLIHD
jgi:benzoyl-CoA reductase/2-hydroxyglutaryl-CoA dehydratase subunit BcrC/BadD/HgdB